MEPETYFTCAYCRAEIVAGDSRWTGLEPAEYWHYACADQVGITRQNIEMNQQALRRGKPNT